MKTPIGYQLLREPDEDGCATLYTFVVDRAEASCHAQRRTMMYTQKHYESMADLIHKRRLAITAAPQATFGAADEKAVRIDAMNQMVIDMVEMFKRDNPKFRELIFIARCNRDLTDQH